MGKERFLWEYGALPTPVVAVLAVALSLSGPCALWRVALPTSPIVRRTQPSLTDFPGRCMVHVSVHVECSVTACHFRRFDSCFPQSPEDSSCHFGHFKQSLLTLPSVLLVFTLCLSRYLYFLIYLTVRDTILYEYVSSQFRHLHKHA